MTGASPDTSADVAERLPPVAELTVASLVLMFSGGIYVASYLPRQPSLVPAVALVAAGGVLTAVAMVLLSRIRPFAWHTFFVVARWSLLAYVVIAGMLAFVFIYDHTPASTLAMLVVTLAIFAVDVPTVIGFTVARYDRDFWARPALGAPQGDHAHH